MSNRKVLTGELPLIPDDYESVKIKAPMMDIGAIEAGKSVFHGNVPIIRKIKKEGI